MNLSSVASPGRRTTGSSRLAAIGLAASPGVWLAGWLVMRLSGTARPGPGWTTAHLLWTVAFPLFGVASVAVYRMAGARTVAARAALTAALVGAAALTGQMLIDLAVGFRSADKAAMSDNYDRVFDVPGVEMLFFIAGPMLLFAGLLAIMIVAATRRLVDVRAVGAVALAIALMVVGRELDGWARVVEALGGVVLWLALVPLARLATRPDA